MECVLNFYPELYSFLSQEINRVQKSGGFLRKDCFIACLK
jgi:hypothetical protein